MLIRSGKSGHVGHQDFEKRFEPLDGESLHTMWEKTAPMDTMQAIDIVLSLLIDEGVSDVGHRKNITEQGFQFGGRGHPSAQKLPGKLCDRFWQSRTVPISTKFPSDDRESL